MFVESVNIECISLCFYNMHECMYFGVCVHFFLFGVQHACVYVHMCVYTCVYVHTCVCICMLYHTSMICVCVDNLDYPGFC